MSFETVEDQLLLILPDLATTYRAEATINIKRRTFFPYHCFTSEGRAEILHKVLMCDHNLSYSFSNLTLLRVISYLAYYLHI